MAGEAGAVIRPVLLVASLLALAAGPAAPSATFAGRYALHERDPFTRAPLDNVLEIVPVDANHAYIRIALEQPNGQSCDVSGVARASANALYYRAAGPDPDYGQRCTLTITRQGGELIFDDSDSRTCRGFCGVNADLSGGFALSSRRPIGYIGKLKRSSHYRAAVAEWRRQQPGY